MTTRIDHDAALSLLRAGETTMAELAEVSGISRQLIRHWVLRAGMTADDLAARRAAYLATAWRRALERG